jgi:hypothetical protein
MAAFQRGLIALVLAFCLTVSNGSIKQQWGDETIVRTANLIDDEIEMMEPQIVPEPEDGSTWWYTPSRKAHIHKHRYSKAIRNLQQEYNKKRTNNKQGEDTRLPGDIIPITYNIRMLPFVELIASGNFTTDGYVEIVAECVRATSNISINSADLDIKIGTISVRYFNCVNKNLNKIALINTISFKKFRSWTWKAIVRLRWSISLTSNRLVKS